MAEGEHHLRTRAIPAGPECVLEENDTSFWICRDLRGFKVADRSVADLDRHMLSERVDEGIGREWLGHVVDRLDKRGYIRLRDRPVSNVLNLDDQRRNDELFRFRKLSVIRLPRGGHFRPSLYGFG